jgi:hypothetical protein
MTTPNRPPLSPAAMAVKRDLAQIMQELSKYCRVSISATDTLPITLETNDTSLEAGINALCAAALRACADQVVPEPPAWEIGVLASADREIEIRHEILAIAAELEGQQSTSSTH